MNTQPPERQSKETGARLDLHSIFYTIQGEGPFTGHRAVFVRLAGCNLQCPGCDTEYTEGRELVTIGEILARIRLAHNWQFGQLTRLPLVVITGGEPLRQPIGGLLNLLYWSGYYRVQIESNGMFAPDEVADSLIHGNSNFTLVVSPKTKKINARTAELADCFKYVMRAGQVDEDGLPTFALEHERGGRPFRPEGSLQHRKIYLNPFDEKDTVKNAANLAACAQSCMDNGYILGVQLHKLVGLE